MADTTMNVNLEEVLVKGVAAELLGKMSAEEKESILKDAIVRKLNDLDTWGLKKLIDTEALRLASEYLQDPEVQEKIRQAAILKANALIDGLIDTFGEGLELWAKSEWRKVLKIPNK